MGLVLALCVAAPLGCGGEDLPLDPNDPNPPDDPDLPANPVPSQLVFRSAPGAGELGIALSPAVEVAIQDADGDIVVAATDAVTIALAANPGSAELGGTTTVDAVDGVASFGDLVLDHSGSGYTLAASSGSLAPDTSAAFDVVFAFMQIVTGTSFSCGLQAVGPVYCWGSNDLRQLGDSTATGDHRTTPGSVKGSPAFSFLTAGDNHACGLTTSGEAYCWGDNSSGQLGDGATAADGRAVPKPVVGGLTFTELAAGSSHTCGLATDGTAHCWGAGDAGQLGDGSATTSSSPVAVAGGLTFERLTAGISHTCGVTTDADAYCWGNNGTSQLGDGSGTNQSEPVLVQGDLEFSALAAGGVHTCGLTVDGDAYCWGFNFFGQLGDSTAVQRDAPTAVVGGFDFARLDAGSDHTCGVSAGDQAFCWGLNDSGRLGDGTTTNRNAPAPVAGALSFSAVSAGGLHTCGLTTLGAAVCWGVNGTGQLGDGTIDGRATPMPIVDPVP